MQKAVKKTNLAQNFISCAIGNLIEIFDFTIYGVLIPILSTLFFPSDDPTVSLLQALSLYGAGFFMRPLGGIFFGHIGDKWGRKKAFVASILMMMISTGSIGFLPTYESIGIAATILLVICRLLQGFSVGGEFIGASLFLLEHTPKRKALWTSMLFSAGATGSLLSMAFGLSADLTSDIEWIWRIPFIASLSIGLVGLYIRSNLSETPLFLENKNIERVPLLTLFRNFKEEFVVIVLVGAITVTFAYGIFVYNNIYFRQHLSFSPTDAMALGSLGIAEYVLLMPLFGWIADRVGYAKVLHGSLLFMVLTLPPSFYFMHQSSWVFILVGQFIFSLGVAAFSAPATTYMASRLPTSVRFTGVAFGYSLGGALLGGLMPAISEYLIMKTGNSYMPMYYLLICSVFALVILSVYHFRRKDRNIDQVMVLGSLSPQT